MRELIPEWLLNKIRSSSKVSCMWDDFCATYKEGYKNKLFDVCGLAYKDQVYYLTDSENASLALIKSCLQASNAIWHSLCVVFKEKVISRNQGSLSLEQIDEIAQNVQIILAGAYDGEGYIFWDKKS